MSGLHYQITNFVDLSNAFREGHCCFSLTDLHLDGEPLNPDWSAHIVQDGDDRAFITIKASTHMPELSKLAIIGNEKPIRYTKLTALVDHQINVRFTNLYASPQKTTSGQSTSIRLNFHRCYRRLPSKSEPADYSELTALLPSTSLRHTNDWTKTEFSSESVGDLGREDKLDALFGTIDDYEYRVTSQGKDLKIHIQTRKGTKSKGSNKDREFYDAFLEALRWLNGGSPFPYFFEHKRGMFEIESWCQTPEIQPTRPRLVSSHPINDNPPEFLATFVKFATKHPERFKKLSTHLWQFRDAAADGPITWGMISQIAAQNEGIATLILTDIAGLTKKKIDKLIAPVSIDRMQHKGSAKAKFYHALVAIDLEWKDFAPTYERWRKSRNPLAHGNYASIREWLNTDGLETYRKLMNSFNWMTLRYINFPKERIQLDHRWFPLG